MSEPRSQRGKTGPGKRQLVPGKERGPNSNDPSLPKIKRKQSFSPTVISHKKRKLFLEALSISGQVAHAARAAGYTSPVYLQKLRHEDEEFAAEWELALESAALCLTDAAIERARDGVWEPTYYKGEVVGHTIKYSDTLLMFVLRKLDPSFRDSARQGDTNINFGVAILPMTAPNDGEWEARAVQMHQGQKVIEVEAKPIENNLTRITRGD